MVAYGAAIKVEESLGYTATLLGAGRQVQGMCDGTEASTPEEYIQVSTADQRPPIEGNLAEHRGHHGDKARRQATTFSRRR